MRATSPLLGVCGVSQHCMALPIGKDINDDGDPFVARAKSRTYRMACKGDPKMCESKC